MSVGKNVFKWMSAFLPIEAGPLFRGRVGPVLLGHLDAASEPLAPQLGAHHVPAPVLVVNTVHRTQWCAENNSPEDRPSRFRAERLCWQGENYPSLF